MIHDVDYGLKPRIATLMRLLLERCRDNGIELTVTEGYRSMDEQSALYNRPYNGKDDDKDGVIDEADEKVTNAKAGQSYHNYGVAFDVCFVSKEGKLSYNGNWEKVGQIGESLGLEWGGRWVTFKDRPHFQFTAGYTFKDFASGKIDWSKFQ